MRGPPAALELLDAPRLAEALRAGIYRVFSRQEHLNKINVFPVPDGDTGTNLAMTLRAVLTAIEREAPSHAGALLTRIADAAIDGARGNSGAILAQFLLGLGDRLVNQVQLTAPEFAGAVRGGAAYARDALTEPREGTILSVLTDFGAELERLVAQDAVRDFGTLFSRSLPKLHESLAATRSQLEALRDANVVDAGAQGFVDLVEGMERYFATGEVGEQTTMQSVPEEEMAVSSVDSAHRFCTECVISGEGIDQRKLREQLSRQGSSLVVAGSQRKVRVHVHTNDPEHVFQLAASFGAVSGQKADDMRRQAAAAHHARSRRVAVVTDSAADIPDDLLERLELNLVPLRVHFGARSYLDKVTLSQEDFFRLLEHDPTHPKTSQPPAGDFRRLYEFLVSHYESVVSISLTSTVSGTFNVARTAAQRLPPGRVMVVNSENASLGQGLIAIYAAECAQAGYSGEEVVRATQAIVPRTVTFGLLGRLDFAVRGGRVPRIVQRLADFLNFVPILVTQPRGRISAGAVLLGKRDLTQRFAALVRKRISRQKRYRVAVGHANAESEGKKLLDAIAAGLDNVESSYLTTLGTALGVHGGPGMLVVGLQEYEPPRITPR
jgi:DegV family protein with EDD domain